MSFFDSLHAGYFVMIFCRLLTFSKSTVSKNTLWKTKRVSNKLDPDQARHFVGPDLGPNCLQRSAADDKFATGKQS